MQPGGQPAEFRVVNEKPQRPEPLKDHQNVCGGAHEREHSRAKRPGHGPSRSPLAICTTCVSSQPLTCLPARQSAEAILRKVLGSEQQWFAVAFGICWINAVNRRYGNFVTDEFVIQLGRSLRSADTFDHLFQWTAGSFLALVRRTDTLQQVVKEMQRIAAVNLEQEVHGNGRTVIVNVRTSSAVFPMAVGLPIETLLESIDAFLSNGSMQTVTTDRDLDPCQGTARKHAGG